MLACSLFSKGHAAAALRLPNEACDEGGQLVVVHGCDIGYQHRGRDTRNLAQLLAGNHADDDVVAALGGLK